MPRECFSNIAVRELNRLRTFRCSTISCCLNAAFSTSTRPLDLKSEAPRLKRSNVSAAIAADINRVYHQTDDTYIRYTQERADPVPRNDLE